MALRRPELELGISGGPDLQQGIIAAIVEFHAGDGLRMAAIQVFGQPQNGSKLSDHLAPLPSEVAEAEVPPLGRAAAVIPGDQRNRFDLVGLEAAQIAVLDQIIRMPMMTLVADVDARVMQNRRIFQPLTFLVGHPMYAAGAIE